jgi:membrane protease subunit HflK
MKKLALLLLIVLVGYALTGVAQVRPGERAVVRRFGRVVAQPGPGLWIGLPWGMDRVERVPVNFVHRQYVGYQPNSDADQFMPPGQMLTGDQNLVNVQVVVDYSVGEGDAVVDFVLSRDRVEPAIARATEAALHEWVAANGVDDVLLKGKVELRQWLPPRVQERIEPYRLGVRVQSASVVYLAAPDDVKPDFERVMIAQSQINTKVNDARQDAARLLKSAEADANSYTQRAAAYAGGKRVLADADAQAFLARLEQYQRLKADNPDILSAIWWAETGKLLAAMKSNGQIDILDDKIGADGLDVTQFARPKKKKD